MLGDIVDYMMASILQIVIITIKVIVGLVGAVAAGKKEDDA